MKNLKALRLELGLTQFELAAATGVPRWKIQLIEAGIAMPTPVETRLLNRTFISRGKK